MLNEFLERLFRRSKDPDSRAEVKQRLKLLIAHDRADLSPALVESMQREILEVVSRYVEIDKSALSFSLESDRNSTALLANLPILRVRDKEDEDGGVEGANPSAKPSDDDREEDSLDNLKFDDESGSNELESSEAESSEAESNESESNESESNAMPSVEPVKDEIAAEDSPHSGEVLSVLDREE
jgi:cell division topological specificity factor